ncbi:hypothetical protein GHC57_03175 [Roseospira navarrensis]|uniref:Uncharacterized protein n=2 Tax=Roseospira navarrensis TaxID=140058 RepID=A0A7X2D291_9PROT|nr:hypothetical protein [Roseospira navarrensis]
MTALVPLLLAGCGAPHMKTIQDAKSALIGQDAAVLTSCLGEPFAVRAHPAIPGRIEQYSSAQARGPDGRLQAMPRPDLAAQARACVFDITVQDDRIRAVDSDNRAGWGFGGIAACSAVVRRCAGS